MRVRFWESMHCDVTCAAERATEGQFAALLCMVRCMLCVVCAV